MPAGTVGNMAVTIAASASDQAIDTVDRLREVLVVLVGTKLRERVDALRVLLPERPADAERRLQWWRSLDSEQARRAMLLDHLSALAGHLLGRPALGYDAADTLPEAALQEAEGFDEDLSELISRYRRARDASPSPAGAHRGR